jgi:hypothetical protein
LPLSQDLVIPKRAAGGRGTCCCMQRHTPCGDSRLGCPFEQSSTVSFVVGESLSRQIA